MRKRGRGSSQQVIECGEITSKFLRKLDNESGLRKEKRGKKREER